MKLRQPEIGHQLLDWYHLAKRNLPWRHTKDPYLIWLSEVILQQTRVNQGLKYYEAFVEQFPKVKNLADAPLDKVLKLWQGLGYYSRARNLHSTAQHVRDELNGVFPQSYDELIKLKGIGPYTAAAISSFSSREPKAVVDGNVIRVVSRLFGIADPVDEAAVLKGIWNHAQDILHSERPDLHNQAMMELGSEICTPKNPKCNECPLKLQCAATAAGKTDSIPWKRKKTKVKNLSLTYYVLTNQRQQVLVRQRGDDSIWKGLFDFPCVENAPAKEPEWKDLFPNSSSNLVLLKSFGPYEHLLSHRRIKAFFHCYALDGVIEVPAHLKWVNEDEFTELAIPRLIDRFWSEHGFELIRRNYEQSEC